MLRWNVLFGLPRAVALLAAVGVPSVGRGDYRLGWKRYAGLWPLGVYFLTEACLVSFARSLGERE